MVTVVVRVRKGHLGSGLDRDLAGIQNDHKKDLYGLMRVHRMCNRSNRGGTIHFWLLRLRSPRPCPIHFDEIDSLIPARPVRGRRQWLSLG